MWNHYHSPTEGKSTVVCNSLNHLQSSWLSPGSGRGAPAKLCQKENFVFVRYLHVVSMLSLQSLIPSKENNHMCQFVIA